MKIPRTYARKFETFTASLNFANLLEGKRGGDMYISFPGWKLRNFEIQINHPPLCAPAESSRTGRGPSWEGWKEDQEG